MLILDQLASRRMFVVYRVVAREDGRLDKIPVDPATGYAANAQDATLWLFPHEALLLAQSLGDGYGVGIVICVGCGIAAIDYDKCREASGGWMPHVAAFKSRFPGALEELSVSRTGQHQFLSYTGEMPPHGVKNSDYRMEAYTHSRFFALTGYDEAGSVLVDHTDALRAFLLQFFPATDDRDDTQWTDTPRSDWRGPTDDRELIERALRSKSAHSIFGGAASFADLWYANVDVLARIFPPQSSGKPYDASRADQALANHLAFWTGGDCERIERLLRLSALYREKHERRDYIEHTIQLSCTNLRDVYIDRAAAQDAKPEELPASVPSESTPPSVAPAAAASPSSSVALAPGELPPVGSYVIRAHMTQMFDGFCYVQDVHMIQMNDGAALPKDRFDARFAGRQYAVNLDGSGASKSAWDAFIASNIADFPKADTRVFKPKRPLGEITVCEGRREINSYRAIAVRRVAGDATPFISLVRAMLPHGDDALILLSYMAACIRYPGEKFRWCPFVQGVKGNGKTTIAEVMQYCIGRTHTHWAKAAEVGEKFNSVFVEKLLVIIDELYTDDKPEFEETLKKMVTAGQMEVRPMYADKMMKDICFNMILLDNRQNAIRIDADERRYAPLFCAQQVKEDLARDGLTVDYFRAFRQWLDGDGYAIVYDYLCGVEIPEQYNPATYSIVAPVTSSTGRAATSSLGGVEQEILEAVEQGQEGFRGGWISSIAVDHLIARAGRERAIPRSSRRALVTALGYVAHPSLPEGLCSVATTDGNKHRLYVAKNHPWAVGHLSAAQVLEGYLSAQKK